MAQKTQVILVDDIDGSEANKTVTFARTMNVPLAALEIHDLGKTVKLRTVAVPKRVRMRICLP